MKLMALSAILSYGALFAATPAQIEVSGPYTHENLSVFLVHAATPPGAAQYVTLKDAMERNQVVVHETKKVNELSIENVSTEPVYIQGGDIVKGGQQDRMMTNDFVLPPKSGRLPVSAFCVEQGRWSQRGSESPRMFSASAMMAPPKVKAAAVATGDQQQVWREVAEAQTRMAVQVEASSATLARSSSSLQLAMENKAVANATKSYVTALIHATDRSRDVVGIAVAVNGKITSGDVYSSAALFSALWPKLLQASAVEAIRVRNDAVSPAPDRFAVEAFLHEGSGGTTISLDKRIKLVRREEATQIVIESWDSERWIHRSYIAK
jgi:hypothetical protein